MSTNKAPKKTNLKTALSREELLGLTTKAFSLEQSEYVAKKIIDQILFLTFDRIRIINVKKMEDEYSSYKTMETIKNIVNLGLIQPEAEYEKVINYNINFTLKRPKVDTWASNQTKILTSVPPEEVPMPPMKKPLSMIKAAEREKERKKLSNNNSKTSIKGNANSSKKVSGVKLPKIKK